MRYRFTLFLFVLFLTGAFLSPTRKAFSAETLAVERIATGLIQPVGLFHSKDGSGRLFIVEQGGTIRIWKQGALLSKPFLDIRNRLVAGGEMGLLGLAFHPQFSQNGRFFVNYTSSVGGLHTVISEFRVNSILPNEADPLSERVLLTIPQPFENHNGGDIVFGPDGFLYIGMGDGGSGNDPQGNAQNLGTLLGKMLRIDVDRPSGGRQYSIPADNPFVSRPGSAPEIWAYGFRNPWRFSFDRGTGRLYVGDVGQSTREEVDVVRKGGNYGWNVMEGTICTPGVNPNCNKSGYLLPIVDYPRSVGTTVIGGYVYRGAAIPLLAGWYIFGDFGSGRIWALFYNGSVVLSARLLGESGRAISSFGEDQQGELYIVLYDGEVYKIIKKTV